MTQILCRKDLSQNAAVVFVVDDWTKNSATIKAWTEGNPNVLVDAPMAYYYGTDPLSAKDEQIIAQRFAAARGDNDVQVRQRLPRTEKKRESILSSPKNTNAVLPGSTVPVVHAFTPRSKGAAKGTKQTAARGRRGRKAAAAVPAGIDNPSLLQALSGIAAQQQALNEQIAAIMAAASGKK